MKSSWKKISIFASASLVIIGCLLYFYGSRGLDQVVDNPPPSNSQEQIVRGAYLAKVANCVACHTVPGAAAYAGGRVMQSEFGEFVTPNITPDKATGIGNWNAQDFWQALHNGKGRDGRLLYPAFPYLNYTQMSRLDSDAIFAYLQTLAPVSQKNAEHRLRFPYDQRPLLAFWRAIYFRPGELAKDASQSVQWNRGAYLYAPWHTVVPAIASAIGSAPMPVVVICVAARWRLHVGMRHP